MEVLKRIGLFKKLSPDFKINRVVTFTKGFSYDFKDILPGAYLVSEPFVSPVSGNYIVTIVNIEDTMSGHDEYISEEAYDKGFTCWNLKLRFFNDIEGVKNFNRGFNFLWKGDETSD